VPRGTLSFSLPEEESEFRTACQAGVWKSLVYELLEGHLRGWLKHGHPFKSADEALEAVQNMVYEEMRPDGLDHLT
jgi:hypothetical protein